MKIYLSEFDVCPEDLCRRHVDYKVAGLLVQALKRHGGDLFYKAEWRKYAQLDREIAACDCLLAIVDEYWGNSTWMCHELNQTISPTNIPGFIYYIPNDYFSTFPRNFRAPNIIKCCLGIPTPLSIT